MDWIYIATLLLCTPAAINPLDFKPCSEISSELWFPCECALGPVEAELDNNPAISINCDRVVFPGDLPQLPFGAPVVSFSQRWAGHQSLPTQVFSSTGLPLRKIDLSGNSLRRLTERLLSGLQSTLVELKLADNLLGDTLNPIFSSNELHGLSYLQHLDLSGNQIKAIEEGILEGCKNLKELNFDKNSLYYIPSSSLNGPASLSILSLRSNRIDMIKSDAFISQQNLVYINLQNNIISTIEGGAFEGLQNLRKLNIAHNRLSRFNSDVFQGADNLMLLDLSKNFIQEFPSIALKAFGSLRYLNLSSNLIQSLDYNDLKSLTSLYELNLSRNNLGNISPGTFLGLKQLRSLDISVNSLRTIEDDAFEGLNNLERLNLKDNNILLIPASALGRLPKLASLQLDYNRVAALSGDIFKSIAEKVTTLVLAKNVVRELPTASFQYFQQLEYLDLTRNLLTTLNTDAFQGLENTLMHLYLSENRINSISGQPIALLKLRTLDLSENELYELPRNVFASLPELKHLNLSHNTHLTSVPQNLLHKLTALEVLDLSHTGLKMIPNEFTAKSARIKEICLSNNDITELSDGAFSNLLNLTSVDLSYNSISNIRPSAFVNVMNIKRLNLKGNQLSSFKGEFFNTGTSLEFLDISDNQLSYLFPSSFRIHPRLKELKASNNKFNFFPAELIATLQFLNYVDLSGNALKTVDELDFARLPRLRSLLLARNNLESVSEMAFHNSTQLQILDLSYNKLDRLSERTFEGLVRLEMLDLEGNVLSDLPETIFERARIQMLENINLARNKFEVAPLKSLQRQYFFVSSVDLSHNKLKDIPADDSIMVNIKNLDLSFNPLSSEAVTNVLGEPKTVRALNLAGTGITDVANLETPFLNYLNLSHNNISHLNEKIFERTTLLETLDLSNNKINDVSNYPKIWDMLHNLQSLNISSNPINSVSQRDFDGLDALKYLSMHSLVEVVRIEKNAFKSVPSLSELDAYDYPKLGYLDIQGVLQNVPALERVNIETKDSAIGSDQLITVLHPRLRELGIRGERLKSISSGALSGIKADCMKINLMNTSLTSLPPALFFSVPRSSRINLDVTGSDLSTLSPQILATLEDRRGDLRIQGLESNPIICDCSARALRRWLPSHMTTIMCSGPEHLIGRLLVEIGDDELTCDPRKVTTTTTTQSTTLFTRNTRPLSKTTEPEIIWSLPPATEKSKATPKKPIAGQTTLNNDDTLIIGIVGGVVAFIAILIIIICIIRLRMTSNQYRGGTLPNGTPVMPVMGPGSSCACSVKGGAPPVYAYGPGYASTLPHKMSTLGAGPQTMRPSNYSTMGRVPYYQNNQQQQPYFIAFPSDEKIYR
ncbi:unnamed protein product [Brassicogethes aeneus]|uniref:LRRCT domain-containing protein n=1 Tax=Brassicogethes aeneus TaxID=1431903 RepID=A0A9P0BCZ1_BRAAE|nr:unnamed protein product [Brassicogethes aeneus]